MRESERKAERRERGKKGDKTSNEDGSKRR
jgi:hypothetical protein